MVKIERSFPAPASLESEAKKVSGSYEQPDVVSRLRKDFHDKCYICELKNLQNPQVEHLLPHKTENTLNENLTGIICFGHAVTAME